MRYNKKLPYYAIKSMYYTIVTDEKGLIMFLSKNYQELLNLEEDDFLGKHVQDIIDNSEIPRVLRTKKEEIGKLFTMKNGETVVCNRIPIFENDILLGVISSATFYNLNEVSKLHKQIENLNKENMEYKKKLCELYSKQKFSIDQVIGNSAKIMDVKRTVQRFANSNLTVLITGETGTGKEVFANAIHKLSSRRNENFVKINCAAIPKDLLESELFGYEPGSFSGANKNGKMGKFELAKNGTLLLDEIGEMPLALQSKLLRVLQEGEIERIGGLKTIKLDVRVICSTNQNIEEQVEKGLFRRDLYYRINVIEIKLPPLRERLADIQLLSKFFIEKINNSYGLGITEIKKDVYALFNEYEWVGNVRELQHVLERACIMAGTGPLELEHFDFLLSKIYKKYETEEEQLANKSVSLNSITSEVEKENIIKALVETNGNKTSAAKLLNIDRSSLYNKLKKYSIDF
ncbi:sigma-54 interaction domain-containing protein [Sedimentibacter sp. MB31-C6]|uniref:sigma-54 interaction domain-containing protein n=1 Tax=Sedimentibacter sp. MB31-C6 TaxID=3109366 RepID=UPI002DDD172A|nr:sigma 54-interacting transcriptional regulator [Sedimentibacter sp. MB36-C1]WSI03677.1 sigma 54-interacting transcriptional regulator [Sedimentibacter sp. MB36-C1]